MSGTTMKVKVNSVRTFDDEGFKRRAACLVFKDISETEVLLVTATRESTNWIVPGGGVEPCEDFCTAAVREVEEEAGVQGTIGRCLGMFENKDRKTRTSVFVMIATKLLDSWEDLKSIGRQRRWFTVEEARRELNSYKPAQGHYLDLITNPQTQAPVTFT